LISTIAQAVRLPIDFAKALLNHNDKGVPGIYARWHMFEDKREAVLAIEAAVLRRDPSRFVWPSDPPLQGLKFYARFRLTRKPNNRTFAVN
jgi:hypothetical protein